MTSPKTVTPDQPQAVPDLTLTERDRITGIIMRHLDATSDDGEQGEAWIVRRILDEIQTETDEPGYWQDKAEGLQADLENAVETAFNRGAVEWTRLNYPAQFAVLAARSDQPQAVPNDVHDAWLWAIKRFRTSMQAEDLLKMLITEPRFTAWVSSLAARPVLPVETPAEGVREVLERVYEWQAGSNALPLDIWGAIRSILASTAPAPLSGKRLTRVEGEPLEWPVAWLAENHSDGPKITRLLRVAEIWVGQGLEVTRLIRDPAPLSGRDGSLREALDECWDDLVNKDDRTSPEDYPDMALITREELGDYLDRATLAAVPPETVEMEGEPAAWLYRPLQAGNLPVARCKRLSDVGDSWQEIPLYASPADRLAARASSSGEAGDA